MADAAETPAAPAPKKKSGWMLKAMIAVLVLGGIGGGAAWYFLRGGAAEAKAKPEPPLAERGLVTFEPFLVNLADQGANRFLKANVQLVVESAEEAKHVEETPVLASHLRSAILELLTQQTATSLVTAEGKESLKRALKERTGPVLGDGKVLDVLFAEFVVQF
ncbi:MAG: flagellar basal body-associated FliL family protein [Acidobacteria bacterium]|nr:flagellar basal body-associated FliL family protein [Acidobacteriota bacterium]